MIQGWASLTERWVEEGEAGTAIMVLVASFVVVPIACVVDAVRWTILFLRELWILSRTSATCPGGHEVELLGAFECSCGCASIGHAWAQCDHCGERAHGISCACGLTVENPLSPVRAAR